MYVFFVGLAKLHCFATLDSISSISKGGRGGIFGASPIPLNYFERPSLGMTLIFKQLQRFTCFLETVGREDVEKDKLQKFWVFTLLLIVFSVYEGRSLEFKLLPYHLSCCWDQNCNDSNIIIYFTKMPKIHEQKINKENYKKKQ